MWGRIYPHVVLLIFTNIIVKASCKGNSSLTFLIDDTGSMYDDIRQVRSSVTRISNIVFNEKSSLIGNMVLVTFNDPDATVRTVTKNRETFKRTLDAVYAHNIVNWDCSEPSMNGLLLALETSNRDSYIYVFTDASAKDYRDSQYVKEMCQKKQSQIVFVLTGSCGHQYGDKPFDVYFDIAHACSGQAFYVTKNNVEKVLETIGVTIKDNKTVITSTIVPAGVKKDIPFTIDDHTDYAIVSVSGKNVELDIKGPSANLEKIMWDENGKVVKLSNAKPGTYVATVKGQTRTSVVIVGRTDFFFTHGFSEQKPKSLGDTSLQPIAESNVHLSISVTDDHHSVQIVSAQILDMNEKPIKGPLPLTEISKDFYVTNKFVAPSQRFKVAVNGIIKATGKPIKRIGKIPITPPEPPKKLPNNTRPIVKIAEGKALQIEYNSTMKLTCKVKAFPEPKIEWANKRGGVMPSKMSLVEYPYKYISYMDISYASKGDKYKCYAANDVGRDETTINVVVKDPFTVKSASSGIKKIVYGTEGILTCDITSHLPMEIHWEYVNEITGQTRDITTSDKYEVSASRTQLKIKKMDLDLVGRYSCKVSLQNKKDVQKYFRTRVIIDGLMAPKVQGATKIKVTKGKTAVFECKVVSGVPAPKISWLFGGKSGSSFTPVGSESVLRITNVDYKHEGEYKCLAENVVGKDEHVTTLLVQDLPKISTSSSKVYQATEGDALLKIPCVAAGVPKPEIIWKLSGRTITPNAKYSIEDGTLTIRIPTVSDTNSYTCEAKNEAGAVSATFKTYIRQAPKLSGVATMKVKLGMPASIECRIIKGEPKPNITWQYMDESASKFVPIHGSETTLRITNAEKNHAGRYKCFAQNNIGSDEHITTLIVEYAPSITTNVSTVEGIEGDLALRIPCDVVGIPKPIITWKVKGATITPDAKHSIEDGALVIMNPTAKDTLSYTCEAKNHISSVSVTFQAKVNVAPKVQGVTKIKVTKGKTAVFECKVVSGIPAPKITWLFGGKSGSSFTPVGSESVLRITNVDYKHEGEYKCLAENVVGKDEHVTTLFVQDLPKISTSSSKVYQATEGDAFLKIPCEAAGVPKPEIIWKLSGRTITPNAKYSIEDGTLTIRGPTVSDTNSYTCEAKNEAGAVSATFKTYIRQAPKVSGVATMKVKLGMPASIECRIIKGEPKPNITWQYMDESASKFVPIHGSETTLRITNAEKNHAGRYKCFAQNNIGSDEHITTLIVEYAPSITTNVSTVEGIEGDLALRIPCDVVGIPKPIITWKVKGATITPDAKHSIEDGALVIMNPTAKDTSSYTCEAKNHISSVSVTFQAKVDEYPKSSGTEHYVYLKKGETRKLKCEAYNSKSQSITWFITRKISDLSTTSSRPELESSTASSKDVSTTTARTITQTQNAGNKEYIQIANASDSKHDGNYTCRVSDKHGNTQTHTYVVDVGNAPKFYSDAKFISNWRGKIKEIKQNCDTVDAKPMPVVQWRFNGKELTDLNSAGVGHYTCNVSNVHGSVLKEFDVKSSACLITRNLRDAQYMPLVLNDEGSWHKLDTTYHFMIVEQEDKITLSCPSQKETSNTFKNFPKKSTLEAICYKEDSFLVEDNIYKLSDLQCTSSIQPSIIQKKVNCSTITSELISVGYKVPGFLEAYEVCFDHKINMPLYTRIIMTDTNDNGLNAGYNWYTYPGIGYKQNEKGFTCKDASSSCCYSKSQLVNAIDFNDGPAKKSTFIDPLNVIPVWLPCDTSKWSWEVINDKVRTQLSLYTDIVVWSGTHTLQEKNGAAIPRYLWKVVRLEEDEVLAIIHVNDPEPTESDIKCKTPDVCDEYEDWTVNGNSTYCCSLPDFLKSFDIHVTDIGESLEAVLDKVKRST